MAATDAPVFLCIDCARLMVDTPLALFSPHPGKCDNCGRCTLIIEPHQPTCVLDSWKGP